VAYTNGTATNYKDLLAVLATFAAANGWTILAQSATSLALRGAGTNGLDEIYVGIETFENTSSGYYNWKLAGSWGWRSGRALGAHPMSSGFCYAYLWNSSIPYWIVATPRRIILVAKVSTIYQMVHLGLGNPPATDNQYPYPLIVGGCGVTEAQAYTVTGNGNSMFWANNGSNGIISRPGGDWDTVGPSTCPAISECYEQRANILTDPSGVYTLDQIYIADATRTSVYAAIDGLYRVSGYGNTPENIITVSGVNYLAVQDVYRNTNGDFCALRLN
jgi:hypothetical protein